jgi:hypothetical protein
LPNEEKNVVLLVIIPLPAVAVGEWEEEKEAVVEKEDEEEEETIITEEMTEEEDEMIIIVVMTVILAVGIITEEEEEEVTEVAMIETTIIIVEIIPEIVTITIATTAVAEVEVVRKNENSKIDKLFGDVFDVFFFLKQIVLQINV